MQRKREGSLATQIQKGEIRENIQESLDTIWMWVSLSYMEGANPERCYDRMEAVSPDDIRVRVRRVQLRGLERDEHEIRHYLRVNEKPVEGVPVYEDDDGKPYWIETYTTMPRDRLLLFILIKVAAFFQILIRRWRTPLQLGLGIVVGLIANAATFLYITEVSLRKSTVEAFFPMAFLWLWLVIGAVYVLAQFPRFVIGLTGRLAEIAFWVMFVPGAVASAGVMLYLGAIRTQPIPLSGDTTPYALWPAISAGALVLWVLLPLLYKLIGKYFWVKRWQERGREHFKSSKINPARYDFLAVVEGGDPEEGMNDLAVTVRSYADKEALYLSVIDINPDNMRAVRGQQKLPI